MKHLLIISKDQFGYLTDVYMWCTYLCGDYSIRVLSFDTGRPRISVKGVSNTYVTANLPKHVRGLLFLWRAFFLLLFFRGQIIVEYFYGCRVFKLLLPWKSMILDVRTMDVSPDSFIRKKSDSRLRNAVKCFDYIFAVSEGVAAKIHCPEEKSAIIPIGANSVTVAPKDYHKLNLLYVGTFFNRNLSELLLGVAKALKMDKSIELSFDIVGDGPGNEMSVLRKLSTELCLDNIVQFHGYVRHDMLQLYYEKCNVGVSFVPMTDYYDHQPPTKTFEYIKSGLYTIATSTSANKKIINPQNGILIDDTSDSFANAIFEIQKKIKDIDSLIVSSSIPQYDWNLIVKSVLLPALKSFEK